MTPMSCEEARREIALGREERVSAHLDRCEACRREAALLRTLLDGMSESASVEPPPRLDASVRAALAGPRVERRQPSPFMVAGLSLGAFSAIVGSISIGLAETGWAEMAPALTSAMAAVYLSGCAVAILPLLLHTAPRRRRRLQEVLR